MYTKKSTRERPACRSGNNIGSAPFQSVYKTIFIFPEDLRADQILYKKCIHQPTDTMSDNKDIFDFDTVKEFSGLIVRQLIEEEVVFIAVLESQYPDENILTEQPEEDTQYSVSNEKVDAIKNNKALLYEIKKQTTVYDFSNLNMTLFVRNRISITTGDDNRYLLNFPNRRYLVKGKSEIMLLQEGDNSFKI